MMTPFIRFLRQRTSIKQRLLLLLLVPGLIYYVFSTTLSFLHSQAMSATKAGELTAVVNSVVVNTVVQLQRRGLKNDLQEVLTSLVEGTDVSAITVYNSDQSVFVSVGNSSLDPATTRYERPLYYSPIVVGDDELDFDSVSKGEPQLVGQLSVQINTETVVQASQQAVVNDTLLFILTLLCCSPLLYVLYQSFNRPLSSILKDIDSFGKGDVSWIDKPNQDSNEFKQVKTALKQVATTLLDQTSEIQIAKESLEYRAKALEAQVVISTEAREAADRANAQKDIFVSNVSHEMRTPLSGVVSSADLLEQALLEALGTILTPEKPSSPETFALIKRVREVIKQNLECVDILKQSSHQLTDMVGDLLSAIDNIYRDIILQPSVVALHDALTALCQSHAARAQQKGLQYDYHIEALRPSDTLHAHCDWVRVSQVINNLINNAINFTEKGQVSVVITLQSSETAITMDVKVADTGIGINDKEKSSIFDLFHIGEQPKDKRYGGMGTGLAIAHAISQRMAGELYLQSSALAQGSIFLFKITLASAQPSSDKPSLPIATKTQQTLTLLYVEDSSINRHIFKLYGEKKGITVLLAENGLEGIERYQQYQHIDALVVDCYMPGMNGYDFVKQIRAFETIKGDDRRIPIFALTADASTNNHQRCIEAGFDEFITKPYTQDTFTYMLDKITDLTQVANTEQRPR